MYQFRSREVLVSQFSHSLFLPLPMAFCTFESLTTCIFKEGWFLELSEVQKSASEFNPKNHEWKICYLIEVLHPQNRLELYECESTIHLFLRASLIIAAHTKFLLSGVQNESSIHCKYVQSKYIFTVNGTSGSRWLTIHKSVEVH